jgi:hypothetical protein
VPVVDGESDLGGITFFLDDGFSGESLSSQWFLAPGARGAVRIISDGNRSWR